MATRRLAALRTRKPLGVRLGGYGVLEDVRPAPAAPAQPRLHPRAVARAGGDRRRAALRAPGPPRRAGRAARARPLLAARAARARAARRRPRRPAARRAARLPPRARPARGPSRARAGPLHRGAARRSLRSTRSPRPSTTCASRPTASSAAAAGPRPAAPAAATPPKAADTALRAQIADGPAAATTRRRRSAASAERAACSRRATQLQLPATSNRPGGFPAILTWRDQVDAAEATIASLEPQVAAANQARRRRAAQPERAARPAAGHRRAGHGARRSRSPTSSRRSRPRTPPSPPRARCWTSCAPASRACRRRCGPATSPTGSGCASRWRAGVAAGALGRDHDPVRQRAGLPARSSPEGQAIDAELRALDDAVDALADLLVAESVHQLVQGNAQRAGATVDALSRGDAQPPDVEVVRTPRAGTAVTHRLLVLADPAAPPPAGRPTPRRSAPRSSPRSRPGRPACSARPTACSSRVRVRRRRSSTADLSVLKLSALDALAMTPAGGPAGATEIELALLDHFAACDRGVRDARAGAGARPGVDAATSSGSPSSSSSRAPCASCSTAPARSTPATSPLPGPATDPGIDAADLAARTAIATGALRRRARAAGGRARRRAAARAARRAGARGQARRRRAAGRRARRAGRARPPRRGRRGGRQRPRRASPPCSATASACCRA